MVMQQANHQSSQDSATTVFIDNLHENTTLGTLWKAFASFGRITNVHRPSKRRIATNTRYAFVGYENKQQAVCAIKEANGMNIDGKRISTQLARPLRKITDWRSSSYQRAAPDPPPPPPPSSFPPLVSLSDWDNPQEGPIKLSPSEILIPRLERSIKVRCRTKSTVDTLWKKIGYEEEVEHIMAISAYDYIVIFHSNEGKQRYILKGKWNCEEWRVDEWKEDVPQAIRMVSIAIRGIPPQAWSEISAREILSKFGNVMEIETDMNKLPVNLEIFATIETSIFKIINEEVEVIFDNTTATVGVVEVWTEELSEKLASQMAEGEIDEEQPPKIFSNETPILNSPVLSPAQGSSTGALMRVENSNFSKFKIQNSNFTYGNGTSWHLASNNDTWRSVTLHVGEQKIKCVSVGYSSGLSNWSDGSRLTLGTVIRRVYWQLTKDKGMGNDDNELIKMFPNHQEGEKSSRCDNIQVQHVTPGATCQFNCKQLVVSNTCVAADSFEGIELEVLLTPEVPGTPTTKQLKRNTRRNRCNPRPSLEARKCFKYGQRLRIITPFPSKSLANIDRTLRRTGKEKRKDSNGNSGCLPQHTRLKKGRKMGTAKDGYKEN